MIIYIYIYIHDLRLKIYLLKIDDEIKANILHSCRFYIKTKHYTLYKNPPPPFLFFFLFLSLGGGERVVRKGIIKYISFI